MIYYKKFDEPVKFTETINGHTYDRVIDGEWRSDNPEVEKVWFSGSLSAAPDAVCKLNINLLTVGGDRFEESTSDADSGAQDRLIAAAEKWVAALERNTVERLNRVTAAAYKVASNIVMCMSNAEWNKLPMVAYDLADYGFIVSHGIVVHNSEGEAAYCLGGNFFRIKEKP